MFWRMIARVSRLWWISQGSRPRSSARRTMSADSSARAAGDAAQGDADLGGGQGGRVVDPVADHAGGPVPGVDLGNRRHLVGRQQAGPLLADAQLAGDGRGCPGVVAGEHGGPQAQVVQLGQDPGRLGPRPVGQADPAQRAGIARQGHRGADRARSFCPAELVVELGPAQPFLVDVAMAAHVVVHGVHSPAGARPGTAR